MYAMMTGKPPFECATVQDTLVRIKSGKFVIPDDFSQEASDLINNLLTQNPSVRMTITDVLNHAFFKRYSPNNVAAPADAASEVLQSTTGQEDLGQMMLTDLASTMQTAKTTTMTTQLPVDELAYQTLNTDDRNTIRQ